MRINPYLILVLITLFFGLKIGQTAVANFEEVQTRRSASIEKAMRTAFE